MVFAVSSQLLIVAPILPRIAEQLDADVSSLASLITAYSLSVGLSALITGPISDRVGRRRILITGTATVAIILGLHAFAQSVASLTLLRGLAGAAGGILSGSVASYVGDYFPSERRGWANGWIMSGFAAGQIAGIPLGTILAQQFGFRAPFLAFSLLMVLTFFLILRFVPQPDVERSREPLTPGTMVSGYRALLTRSATFYATAVYMLMFASTAMIYVFYPAWMETELGASATTVALMFALGGVANVFAGPRSGKLSDRIGRKPAILAASLSVAATMTIAGLWARSTWAAVALFAITMGLLAARSSPFQALLTELVDGRQRGQLMSLALALGHSGFGLSSLLAGHLYARYGFTSNALLGAALILLAAWLIWKLIPETRFSTATAPPETRAAGGEA